MSGINIQSELFSFNNNGSASYLECTNQMTADNGFQVLNFGNNYCPPSYT